MKRISGIFAIASALLFCVSGCSFGGHTNETDITTLQSLNSTAVDNSYWAGREKEKELFLEISSQYKNELNAGKQKYHIDAAEYEFDVYLSFDPEEYYQNVNDETFFDLDGLLERYNWKEIDSTANYDLGLGGSGFGRTFTYEYSDLTIIMKMQFIETANGINMLSALSYSFVKTENMEQPYYEFIDENYAPSNDAVCDFGETQLPDCIIDKANKVYTSDDVCLLLSAVISWVEVKPEGAPFLYLNVPHPLQSTEYRRVLGFDLFEMIER